MKAVYTVLFWLSIVIVLFAGANVMLANEHSDKAYRFSQANRDEWAFSMPMSVQLDKRVFQTVVEEVAKIADEENFHIRAREIRYEEIGTDYRPLCTIDWLSFSKKGNVRQIICNNLLIGYDLRQSVYRKSKIPVEHDWYISATNVEDYKKKIAIIKNRLAGRWPQFSDLNMVMPDQLRTKRTVIPAPERSWFGLQTLLLIIIMFVIVAFLGRHQAKLGKQLGGSPTRAMAISAALCGVLVSVVVITLTVVFKGLSVVQIGKVLLCAIVLPLVLGVLSWWLVNAFLQQTGGITRWISVLGIWVLSTVCIGLGIGNGTQSLIQVFTPFFQNDTVPVKPIRYYFPEYMTGRRTLEDDDGPENARLQELPVLSRLNENFAAAEVVVATDKTDQLTAWMEVSPQFVKHTDVRVDGNRLRIAENYSNAVVILPPNYQGSTGAGLTKDAKVIRSKKTLTYEYEKGQTGFLFQLDWTLPLRISDLAKRDILLGNILTLKETFLVPCPNETPQALNKKFRHVLAENYLDDNHLGPLLTGAEKNRLRTLRKAKDCLMMISNWLPGLFFAVIGLGALRSGSTAVLQQQMALERSLGLPVWWQIRYRFLLMVGLVAGIGVSSYWHTQTLSPSTLLVMIMVGALLYLLGRSAKG